MLLRSLVPVCVVLFSFAAYLQAGWSERGWCHTPLQQVDNQTTEGATSVLAQGVFLGSQATLYLTSRSVAEMIPDAQVVAPPRIGGNQVALHEARVRDGIYGVEIGNRTQGRHVLLILRALSSELDLQECAQRFVDASHFSRRDSSQRRGVLLEEANAVLSLPLSFVPFSKGTYLERSSGGLERVIRILPVYPTKEIPDAAFLQRQSEESLRQKGYEATSAGSLWLFGNNTQLRHFTYKDRYAAAVYAKVGDWLFLFLIEAKRKEGVRDLLQELEEESVVLQPWESERRSLKHASKLEALVDGSGVVRVMLLNAGSEPIIWRGPLVPFELLNGAGAILRLVYIRDGAMLGMRGEGIAYASGSKRIRARLPSGESLEAKILSPPG